MDERLKFIERLLAGERMAVFCRKFDLSCKTGNKLRDRYEKFGVDR